MDQKYCGRLSYATSTLNLLLFLSLKHSRVQQPLPSLQTSGVSQSLPATLAIVADGGGRNMALVVPCEKLRCCLKHYFSGKKQPPPTTVTMVAGGGSLIPYLMMFRTLGLND